MEDLTKVTLNQYLNWLEKEWQTFNNPLYTLENYLAMGTFVWNEKNS